jgi:hypothetical protein
MPPETRCRMTSRSPSERAESVDLDEHGAVLHLTQRAEKLGAQRTTQRISD